MLTRIHSCSLAFTLAATTGACIIEEAPPQVVGTESLRVTSFEVIDPATGRPVTGIDIDDNGSSNDNILGAAFRTLKTEWPSWDPAPFARAALEGTGFTVTRIDRDDDSASFVFDDGVGDPGAARFGAFDDGVWRLRDGQGRLPLGLWGRTDDQDPDDGWIDGGRVTAEIRPDGAGIRARVGVSLRREDVIEVLAPRLARFFDRRHQTEPTNYTNDLDVNDDGEITTQEVADNQLFQLLLIADLTSASATEPDEMSFAFDLTAAP